MEEVWKRIQLWVGNNAPALSDALFGGVIDEQVKELEEVIEKKLPEDFIESYKLHNGQDPDQDRLVDGEELLSFDRIVDEWKIWKELYDSNTFENENGPLVSAPETGIKNDWWNPAWIPVTYDGCGNHYCMDLDPGEDGNYGQIIRMWHDSDERELVASSFKEWLSVYADDLESGAYCYSEEYGGIIELELAKD